jgi:DNA-binding response OmpR family regulator
MTSTGCTVLVVDDDKMNRIMLAKLLEHEGYEAKTVVNGREALAAIEEEPFDAVLLDILMPEIDGFEVLQKIKYDSRLWHIPVIMISAVEERESIVRCLQIGADDYVVKPFDPVLLRARINACLARRRFRDLEVEYQKVVAEQATELEEINRGLNLGRLRRFLSAPLAERAVASATGGSPAPPHRREVAVVSCELTGFGALVETADPADALGLLNGYYAIVGEVVPAARRRWPPPATARSPSSSTTPSPAPNRPPWRCD